MSSITEQFSAVTKSQLEAQFNLFNSFAHTAVDSAEKLIALNLNATKASVEKSSATAKKLLEIKDAKELFIAGRDEPTGLDSLLAYSRELFAIASGAQAELIKSTRSPAPVLQPAALLPAAAAGADAVQAAAPVVTRPAAAVVAAVDAAPVAAPAVAPAPPATTIEAAVTAAVQPADAPASPAAVADAVQPQPLAATVAPTAPEHIQVSLEPSSKSAFPAPKPIALAAENKPAKLKPIAPKGKTADVPAGKHKK